MTDPFSAATGAVGVVSLSLQLLGGCIRGFVLLSTAHNLGKDASTIVCMLNIQELQLTEWAQRAGLLSDEGILDRRLNANAVEEILHQIQGLLSNSEKLKKRYGLTLIPYESEKRHTAAQPQYASLSTGVRVSTAVSDATRNWILARAKVAQDQNVFKRLWWAAVDKEKIEKLVADVHFLVRELWNLLDPWRHDDLVKLTTTVASSLVSINNRFDQLTSLVEALSALQENSETLLDSNFKTLTASAEVKALRVGLDNDGEGSSSSEPTEGSPKRQELLRALEHLPRGKLTNFTPMKKHQTMGLADYGERKVFVEQKALPSPLRKKLLHRAENLAALLSMPKYETFRSLSCRGIVEQDDRVSFVFQHPFPDYPEQPRTLLDFFSAKDGIESPSLTVRVNLALRIAQVIQNFHRAGWLHKSLRSENILFFSKSQDTPTANLLDEPMLAGFAFARFGSPTEISEQPSADPKCDIYRHPSALGEPTTDFSEAMDVYSLGTVLLEIAEWRALRYLVDSVVDVGADNVPLTRLAGLRPFLLGGQGKGGTSKLRTRMGDIYASVCLMCLAGKVDEAEVRSDDKLAFPESLLDVAVRRLESCRV